MNLQLTSKQLDIVKAALDALPIHGPVVEVRDILLQIDSILDQIKLNGTTQNPS